MRGTILLVEHRQGGRVLKKLKLYPEGRPVVIGANPKADIRLVGAEVSQFHAVLEPRKNRWYIFDFGSQTGTWINKESVLEVAIDKSQVVKIGLHELHLQPVESQRELFKSESTNERPQDLTHHQIVVRTASGVLETHVLPRTRSFKVRVGGEEREFAAPPTSQWLSQQAGGTVIQQRLVAHPGSVAQESRKVDEAMRWPLFGTTLASLIVAIVIGLSPKMPDEVKTLPELENNRFAGLIYDAKLLAEKKKESKALSETQFKKTAAPKGAEGGNASASEVAKGTSPVANKLITQVKASGLSALIGKVAKRTALNADTIASAAGRTADQAGTGRAMASVGALVGATGTAGSPNGTGFKLAAVGTSGKGGGGSYKQGTGLGTGGIGTSSVGIIEEEGEVEGGLDKDLIAEVIKSELGQIRYCYERQLTAQPELYGKVLIKFTIGTNGLVTTQQVGSSTLNNADVEGCILRRVARWKFPTPKGGTTVMVTYPFMFKSNK